MGPMHLQHWQVRAYVVSPSDRSCIKNIYNVSRAGNTLATVFPLYTSRMNDLLTYKWAGTVFALIAAIMIPIPYVSDPNTLLYAFAHDHVDFFLLWVENAKVQPCLPEDPRDRS